VTSLKTQHADEQRFRNEQLARLQRLKADVQRKQDALMDRLLDGTITKEAYSRKSADLEKEHQNLDVSVYEHEEANRSWFTQAENFLEITRSIYHAFLAGSPQQKRQVVQQVAWNGVLTDRNARLTLKRPAQILADRQTIPYGVTDGT
jgi:hypothetical protein